MHPIKPLVSVSMITYCAESFLAQAIEGVLQQRTDFSIELVISDDCSTDNTRKIAETYAEKYPEIIRVLPQLPNKGITGNTARVWGECRGLYIAVCDGDDIWIDPLKLQKQVDFLERHPEFGLSYSDMEPISKTGAPIVDADMAEMRLHYQEGEVFFPLIEGNFIGNSSVVFRRKYLESHKILPDRSFQIQDHVTWLHIAACGGKAHFLPVCTTQYRRHSNSLSVQVPGILVRGNKRMFRRYLFKAIVDFDQRNDCPLSIEERTLLFRRILSLLLRGPGTLSLKWDILRLLPRYFPGIWSISQVAMVKLQQAVLLGLIPILQLDFCMQVVFID